MIWQLMQGLFVLSYMLFSYLCVYLVLVSTKKPDNNMLGKIVYANAYFVVIVMTLTVIGTLSFVFANTIINVMQAHIMIGG